MRRILSEPFASRMCAGRFAGEMGEVETWEVERGTWSEGRVSERVRQGPRSHLGQLESLE